MSNKETDILLIRKYLNGELDAHAMHQFEKRAQADPFLMDALEGYEKIGKDQGDQLNEISEQLSQRIEKKERRIVPWRILSIAASVLIVITIGGLLLFNKAPVQKDKKAQVILTRKAEELGKPDASALVGQKAPAPLVQPVLAKQAVHIRKNKSDKSAQINSVVVADEIANADVSKVSKNGKDTITPLNEVIVMGYTTQKKRDVTGAVTTISPGYIGKSPADSPATSLNGSVAGISIASADNAVPKSIKNFAKNRINGRVIAKDDGQPLVGVTVRIAGTNRSTITDVNGKFSLHADSGKNSKLQIAYIGFNNTEVTARPSDSLKSIAMVPSSANLNEVVVVGYGAKKEDADDDNPVIDAHPINGWSSLKKYFDENAVSPDGKKGIVKLSFIVDRNGNISNIKVIKSVSTETDAKAIDLLNNGPGWAGSTSKRTETVTVRVKFTK